ncbi:MAG: substrate-binding domain-containing protein, partial [Candidatus Methylomirabilales bacterium]
PAKIKGTKKAVTAFRQIARAKASFVSRGDNSGTHLLEKRLWKEAGMEPKGSWYIEAGQGMGATLRIASEKYAYTLTDRGTYLAFRKRIQLQPMVEGDSFLLNFYSVMEVNPAKFPKVNHAGARAFGDFLVSPEVQVIIKTFGMEQFGEPLFIPALNK